MIHAPPHQRCLDHFLQNLFFVVTLGACATHMKKMAKTAREGNTSLRA
jgi:hypothetical protein